jgi:eukaryotic-like serine/threonine-protein kinase
MRWCARCRRRLYDQSASFCPFDGTRLEIPDAESGSDPYLGVTLQGQFHLVAAIGSGAMGTVYRAWQSGMERQVAVKLLRADLTAELELRRRFLREGRTAARLNHPNIVSVYMVGETDAGVPYIVMEHLGGETLDELLDREGRLAPARAIAIARQIASALSEAHAAGVVHRDLKPGNVVLLQCHGAGELVKIFDFGIAKLAEGALLAGDASRLTREGDIFGTPHYIAPEQAQAGTIDGRADLYSLGVLLYEMLAGRLPFEGNAVAVLLAHIGKPPPDLAVVAPHVPPALAGLVMRCLAKQPDQRFATADDLIAALDRASAPIHAPAPAVHSTGPAAKAPTVARRPSTHAPARAAPVVQARPVVAPVVAPIAAARPAVPPIADARAAVPPIAAAPAGPGGFARLGSADTSDSATSSWIMGRPALEPRGPAEPSPDARESGGRTNRRAGEPAAPALDARESGGRTSVRWGVAPPPRGRVRAAALASIVAFVCAGAGTGAAELLRWTELGDDVAAPVDDEANPVPARGGPARRSVMLSDRGYAVRALLPEPITAGESVELLFDVWDRDGQPLASPAIPVELASVARPAGGDSPALAARPVPDLPGRYALEARFAEPGEAAALLELTEGGSIHVHFEVANAAP